jgi:hypothetical protein
MRAILVGSIGDRKIYYDIDAKSRKNDAFVEKPDGSLIPANFFSLISKSNNIKKIKTTRFHQTLWGGPSFIAKKDWESIFIQKTEPMTDAIISGTSIITDLGKEKKTKNKE